MGAIRTILVASDLSPHAEVALGRAGQLAEQHGAAIELLCVLDPQPASLEVEAMPPGLESSGDRLETDVEQALRTQATALAGRHPVEIRVNLQRGKDFVGIIRRARDVAADLIVLGGSKSGTVRRLLAGSVAERVIRKGDRPVLTARKRARGDYARVLVATDFSDPSRQALELAARLAPQAEVRVLYSYELWGAARLSLASFDPAYLTHYHRYAREQGQKEMSLFLETSATGACRVEMAIEHGHPAEQILKAAQEWKADLIAMGTRGRTGLPYVMLGSVAQKVLHHAACDVLVAPAGAGAFQLP